MVDSLALGRGPQVGAGGLTTAVLRDQAADGHAREAVEQRPYGRPHGAADVLEIDVDPVRAGILQLFGEGGRAVVDGRADLQFFQHMAAFVAAAGDPSRACARQSGELSDQGTDWTA